MFQLNSDKKIEIDFSIIQKPRHVAKLNRLLKNKNIVEALSYKESFLGSVMGWSQRRVLLAGKQTIGKDILSYNKNKYSNMFNSLINPDISHRPWSTSNNFIGIEIEFYFPKLDDETEYEAKKRLADQIKLNKIKGVTVKDDGSIRCDENDYAPCEVTCLTSLNDFSNLKKLCQVLKQIDARVNKTCGMHVHLDARHLDTVSINRIGRNFLKALPVLSNMVPQSRRNNQYCQLNVSKLNGSRYYAVNLTAFKKYQTIEIRLHSATTDFYKITQWIKLLNAIKHSSVKKTCTDINDLTEYVKIDENLMEYVAQRTSLFSSQINELSIVDESIVDHDFDAA